MGYKSLTTHKPDFPDRKQLFQLFRHWPTGKIIAGMLSGLRKN
jgi:hypothetical protein